jgi:hypothetical protein
MSTRRLIMGVGLAALMATIPMATAVSEAVATPIAAPIQMTQQGTRTVEVPISHLGESVKAVDCIGDGASCVGYLNQGGDGNGDVVVTNNTNPRAFWRFKLTCERFGDQYSGDNAPSAGSVKSHLKCNFSDATHWTVLVDYKP